jgi:polyisoprenoid-binding protein YceI
VTTGITLIPAGTWVVDPARSYVGFALKHLGISTVRSEFKEFDGTLERCRRRGPTAPSESPRSTPGERS